MSRGYYLYLDGTKIVSRAVFGQIKHAIRSAHTMSLNKVKSMLTINYQYLSLSIKLIVRGYRNRKRTLAGENDTCVCKTRLRENYIGFPFGEKQFLQKDRL